MTPEAVEDFRRALGEMGEQQVRRVLSRGSWDTQKVHVAEQWLEERIEARQARGQRESVILSRWALAVAALSLLVAILALFRS